MYSSDVESDPPSGPRLESLLLKLPEEILAHILLHVAHVDKDLLDGALWGRRSMFQLALEVQAID